MASLSQTLPLTSRSVIEEKCLPPRKDQNGNPAEFNKKGLPILQKYYWHLTLEKAMKLFGLCVGFGGQMSWVVQCTFGTTKKQRRFVIAEYPDKTLAQILPMAAEALVDMRAGRVPKTARQQRLEAAAAEAPKEWETMTLARAMAKWIKGRRAMNEARNVRQDANEMKRLLADWRGRVLITITAADFQKRYQDIFAGKAGENGDKGGQSIARRVMRNFNAAWAAARAGHNEMPESPFKQLSRQDRKRLKVYKIKRRQQPIPWAELPDQWAKVQTVHNPVERDFWITCLFTGLRSTDCKSIRVDEIRSDGTLHRPNPKGGEDKRFDVPLPEYIRELLKKRIKENGPDCVKVFPGLLDEDDEAKTSATWARKRIKSPHRARDTFATAMEEVELTPTAQKILMNHSLESADVTDSYKGATEKMCSNVEKVSLFIQRKIGIAAPEVAKIDFTAALVEQNKALAEQNKTMAGQLQQVLAMLQQQQPVRAA